MKHSSPQLAPLAALEDDPHLAHFIPQITSWQQQIAEKYSELCQSAGVSRLADFALGHLYFGVHRQKDGSWILREWAPNATEMYVYGDATEWQLRPEYSFEQLACGVWQLQLPREALQHEQYFALWLRWNSHNQAGEGRRLPSYSRRVVQDRQSKIFSAQIWETVGASESSFPFRYSRPKQQSAAFQPIIYEAHVGMAQEYDNIGNYRQFREHILPYIADLGYNTVQLMAIQEHPYYGSFGYHVSNLFAVSSRFGTPEEFKALVDEAHRLGLCVIIDLVHSHHVRNEEEGLGNFAGDRSQYFYPGSRGEHLQWDSYVYDYGKNAVLHYLLSNLQFWLCEYNIDGFRFDGVTSMLYEHRGMGESFANYDAYFNGSIDSNALVYLALANRLIHEVWPHSLTIAEEVSGFPGLGACELIDFDYRLAMGVTDHWFKLLDIPDENWNMFALWHQVSQGRADERTISYVESHDQALVGGKSLIFTIIDSDMYWHMELQNRNLQVDRGLALHKMARLLTLASCRHGYLNFMGNEFGHPEWIDFPREGNNWSYHYSRRLWSLAFRQELLYQGLRLFEQDMQALFAPERLRERQENWLNYAVDWLHISEHDKFISFRRGPLLLLFNFHPSQPLCDYKVPAPKGKYTQALCSDALRYNGYDLIDPDQHYYSRTALDGTSFLQVYLPPRIALVLQAS